MKERTVLTVGIQIELLGLGHTKSSGSKPDLKGYCFTVCGKLGRREAGVSTPVIPPTEQRWL
jgi:hypothetical protein